MKITLDADHIYRVDGVEKPSVSLVLESTGLIDTTWYNDYACIRGTYVHKAVELYHTVGLNLQSLDSELIPYFDAYLDFAQKNVFKPVIVEKPAYCPIYGYCGTADLIGPLRGELDIIDIKTGVKPSWVGLQLAAYQNLWDKKIDQKPIRNRFVLELRANGKWSLTRMNNPLDKTVFFSALTVYNYKKGII